MIGKNIKKSYPIIGLLKIYFFFNENEFYCKLITFYPMNPWLNSENVKNNKNQTFEQILSMETFIRFH